MMNLLVAEHLKGRRTLSRALPIAAPAVDLLLVLVLTGGIRGALPAGAWNWWYTALLPGMLAVMCYLSMQRELRTGCFHLRTLPQSPRWLLLGKMIYLSLDLLLANLLLLAGVAVGGALLGSTIPLAGSILGALLLTVCHLWSIPLYVFLNARFGLLANVLCAMTLSGLGVAFVADQSLWWLCPSAIPARLMCPVMGLLPNGLPLPADSALWNSGVLLPGLLLSLVWLAVFTLLVLRCFEQGEA